MPKTTVKPTIAFKEDVDVWVYYDQVDELLRYEIYCIGYDEKGNQTTLEFVVEEGIVDPEGFPSLAGLAKNKTPQKPLLPLNDGVYLLVSDTSNKPTIVSPTAFACCERQIKTRNKHRILKKLQALGYDVLPSANG